PAKITVSKAAKINDTLTSSQIFSFIGSPAPLPSTFTLCGDPNPCTAAAAPTLDQTQWTSYTITETPIPTGWIADGYLCTVSGGLTPSSTTKSGTTTSVTIPVQEGDNWSCTFLNHQLGGTLTLVKDPTNSHGGNKQPNDFQLTVN